MVHSYFRQEGTAWAVPAGFAAALAGFLPSGIPLGLFPLAIVVGYSIYRTIRFLRFRAEQGEVEGPSIAPPTVAGGFTLRGRASPPPYRETPTPRTERAKVGAPAWQEDAGADGAPGDVPPRERVTVWTPKGTTEIDYEWKPPTASAPPPVNSGFGLKMTVTFVGIVVVLILIHSYLFLTYDFGVRALAYAIYWPLSPPPFVHAPSWGPVPFVFFPSRSPAIFLPDYIYMMYLSGLIAYFLASGLYDAEKYGPERRRTAWLILLAYTPVEMMVDVVFFSLGSGTFATSGFLLVRGLLGGLFLALMLFTSFVFPVPMTTLHRFARKRGAIVLLIGTAILAIVLSAILLYGLYLFFGLGRDLVPFAVLLLLPLFAITFWGVLGRIAYDLQLAMRPRPSVQAYHPPVSVVIPAYNEGPSIGATIAAADRAARLYPGFVEIVVGNDGSTDNTFEAAKQAMQKLQHASGVVVDLPHGGKSNALNGALRVALGEILIRVDADTRISDVIGFGEIVPHFADPEVGGVQGLILPLQREGWTRKLRFMEIAWNHLFLRRAMMATRSCQVVDGAFCAFRRRDLLRVGGWVPWNGEDTEITLRLERVGYKFRFETRAAAFEDVPANYRQLKKQRIRWNRGGLFAHRRHFGALFSDAPEYGGLAIMVWLTFFIRGGMRTLVYVYAALVTVLLGLNTAFHLFLIVALLLIPRGFAIAYYLAKFGRYRYLPYVPIWPITGAIKQFFSLEAFGTMLPGGLPEFSD
jgi:cellulose synthase/poly-beta-1,6-N-acetylglucosamine synthase-like glycosyltransferase